VILRHKKSDHAKLREAMIARVRETGNNVLVCRWFVLIAAREPVT
jgi:hypothetical protein